MGATLPVLVAVLQRSAAHEGSSIARLYTWNLLGAIVGAIGAGFFLLPFCGVRATIWIAAATNLLIGLTAFLVDSKSAESQGEVPDSFASVVDRKAEVSRNFGNAKFWLFCAFTSGFMTISMQVVWSRMLAMIIGSSTYAFSIVLALFILGLAIGAYLVSANKNSNAWTLLGAYELSTVAWKPKLSYRYASFEGDNPSTTANEGFDPLLPGFSDWGSWWQGEIAGEYFLSNSNLNSHQFRAHVTPNDRLGGGLIFYDFWIDQPQSLGPAVTDNHAAFEGDLYVDWKVSRNLVLSVVTAFADPGAAVKQVSGRTKNLAYGMVYLAYSY
jgi:hypothetical protein